MEVGYIPPPITLGHEDEAKTLLQRLVGGPKHLDVVPIVGMPGLGKTTLATKLYSHEAVRDHYDVRSWCCVSQTYDRKSVLLEIMRGLDKENTTTEESVLVDKIRKFLKGKRYLVVVDDLWSTDAWDDLRPIFPDDNKGSRVVLTTRLNEVASYASTNSHHLRNLTEEESWELLEKIVFGEESCPSELEETGNEIARSCAGLLPLAIVLSAGLLARGEKEVDYWKEVSQNLSSTLFHDANWLMEVVELSYKNLPHDLKPCFLYFGSFSEDEKISVQKLIQLWICEGFIPHNNDLESLDHVATDCLTDLVGRNLVMVSKRTFLGKAKYIHIHDLLHQFCMKKAEEIHLRFYGSEISDYDHPQQETAVPYRFLVSSLNDDFMKWSSPCESSRSLRFAVSASLNTIRSLDDSLEPLKSLTVLDLGRVDVGLFPDRIMLLIHLIYLEINANVSVPSTIGSLVNLETLIMHNFVYFPDTMWDLVNLRHLQVHSGWFPVVRVTPHKVPHLKKLETCSKVNMHLPRDMRILVHELSNVVNLKCRMVDESSDPKDYDCNKPYDADDYRYEGKWDVKDNEFPKLKVLKVIRMEFIWNLSEDAFPSLQQLLLKHCYDVEIPSSFGYMSSLKFVKLRYCSKDTVESAMKIKEVQIEEMANSDFKLVSSKC